MKSEENLEENAEEEERWMISVPQSGVRYRTNQWLGKRVCVCKCARLPQLPAERPCKAVFRQVVGLSSPTAGASHYSTFTPRKTLMQSELNSSAQNT